MGEQTDEVPQRDDATRAGGRGDVDLVVGVGPWVGPWPGGEHWDPELLRDGDRRNVVDRYRYWRHDAIVADLDTRRHDFHVAIENWGHDFNIGSVVRTANAFNAKAFHIIGRRRWNRRGAMVTDRYQHELHHPAVADLVAWAATAGPPDDEGRPTGMPLVGIDNLPGSRPLETATLPRHCVLVFGQEGPGLSEEVRAACAQVLHIEQFGSTRSINAGAAAAVAMHAWVRQHVFAQDVGGQHVVGQHVGGQHVVARNVPAQKISRPAVDPAAARTSPGCTQSH